MVLKESMGAFVDCNSVAFLQRHARGAVVFLLVLFAGVWFFGQQEGDDTAFWLSLCW